MEPAASEAPESEDELFVALTPEESQITVTGGFLSIQGSRTVLHGEFGEIKAVFPEHYAVFLAEEGGEEDDA